MPWSNTGYSSREVPASDGVFANRYEKSSPLFELIFINIYTQFIILLKWTLHWEAVKCSEEINTSAVPISDWETQIFEGEGLRCLVSLLGSQ